MPVQIEEDTSKSGGHAVITIGAAAATDLRFSIRRLAGDPDNLGPQGWQNSKALLEPASSSSQGGNAVVVAGPEICDHIEVDTQIEIAFPALGIREMLFWPYIAPSARVQGGATMGGVTQPSAAKPAVSEARPEPVAKADETQKAPEPEDAADAADENEPEKIETTPDPQRIEDKDDGDDKKKGDTEVSRFRALFVLLPLLLIAAGGAAYYFWPVEPTPPPGPSNETPQPPSEDPSKSATKETPADTREARDRLRDMNRENASADAFYEYALKLIQAQKFEDGFLAMDIAGQKGHAKALFQLGQWYDPKTFDTKMGFSNPNPVSAAEYYRKAEAKGLPEAKAALGEICKVLANKDALPPEQATVAADAQARFCTP